MKKILGILFAFFLIFSGFCQTITTIITYTNRVTLAWDPSPDSSVTGYKIYYGIASGTYTNNISFGNATNATISNLTSTVTYYFAATAYNAQGDESIFSNEASYSVPAITNFSPTISSIPNQNIPINSTTPKIAFIINDVDTPISLLTLSASSTNTSLVNSNSFLFTGTTTNRNLYVTPITNKTGTSEITITVKDSYQSTGFSKFLLTVSSNVNLVYLGTKLEYGTNLNFLTTTNIMFAIITNPPTNQFYRSSLIITNKPF